jgi:two-component system, chemotaxis family, response regulator Rcp1
MFGGKYTVLIIEDNAADVQLLRLTFEDVHLNCDLIVVTDGEQALAWVRDQPADSGARLPDLAIVDLNLPKHDGVEVLSAMRKNSALAGLPILVLSSSPRPSDVARVSAFPNTRYATKPSFLEAYGEIAETVRQMLELSR